MRVALVLVILLLAGCTSPAGDKPTPSSPVSDREAPEVPTREWDETPTSPEYAPSRPLVVTASAMERWVRPGDLVVANASASGASSYAWFLASRNPDVPGNPPSTTFGRKEAPVKIAPGETVEIVASRALRHFLGLEGGGSGRLNVTAVDGPTLGGVTVRITGTPSDPVFFPDDIKVPIGGRVLIQSDLSSLVTLRGLDVMAPLGRGASLSFPATNELGDYDDIVVAEDGSGGRGGASIRLIVDKRKPEANQTLGPWTGTLQRPALGLPGEAPNVHEFELEHPARAAFLTFNSSSSAPVDPELRLRVLDVHDAEVASTEGAAGELDLGGLPAGTYRLAVDSTGGVSVSYAAEVRVELLLLPPDSFFNT